MFCQNNLNNARLATKLSNMRCQLSWATYSQHYETQPGKILPILQFALWLPCTVIMFRQFMYRLSCLILFYWCLAVIIWDWSSPNRFRIYNAFVRLRLRDAWRGPWTSCPSVLAPLWVLTWQLAKVGISLLMGEGLLMISLLSFRNKIFFFLSISAISQLLLAKFGSNFKQRVLGTYTTDFNCHHDICPCNIFPGDICLYQ